jgi:hypothetical protein
LYPDVTSFAAGSKRFTLYYLIHTEHIVKSGKLLLLGLALAAAAGSSPAWAHGGHGYGHGHGHSSFGLYLGVPLGVPYYYPAPAYAYSAPIIVNQPPTVYIERDPQPASGYWYYCRNPQGYYPQVPSCPTPWQQVPANPTTR